MHAMTSNEDDITHRFQELLDELVSRKPHRQAVIAIERGDRSFQWSGAAGTADASDTPMTTDTPFFLASIDKLYNAVVVLKLFEMVRLNLDAPITEYLPDSVTRNLHCLDGADYSERISIRHLLSHTSGLADWLEDSPKEGRSLVGRITEDGDMSIDVEEMTAYVRDRLKPHFPPQDLSAARQKARYSDTNFMLLIAIIEAVMSEPLHVVHERILYEPYRIRKTFFPGSSQPHEPALSPAKLRVKGEVIDIPRFMRSVRGMYSTTDDAIAFLRILVRGEVFQNPDTFGLMSERWNRFGFPFDRAALRAPGWPIEYGLGLMRFQFPRIFSPFHPMPSVIGHTGSTGCWLFYCRELDLYLCGSVDEVTAGAVPYRIVPKILQIVRDANRM